MAKIVIDGKECEVSGTKTIIQAALDNGIQIPHFCWHPSLSVAGNCRICLVEVEKFPKLAIACSTVVTDGMVVKTQTPRVINAQQAVMEFLLINHPLDCPICDEAGECKLQDYAYRYSEGVSRFEFDKVRKPKRVELGPRIMLDTERCIMCSRCIRFCDEVVKKPQLVFTQRCDHIELTTFPGERLDNPYSMNTIDLCPVGALTSRDFRFKARVWEMSSTDTICIGCSRGCNTKMWVRNNEILRLTPRFNPDVNGYWMCDHGRLDTFKSVNSPQRIKGPSLRKERELIEVGWDEAVSHAASELKSYKKHEIAAVGSPFATNEDNYLFVKFLNYLGVKKYDFRRVIIEGDEDGLLIRADKTPNSRGAREVGVLPADPSHDFQGILGGIERGEIKALYVTDESIGGYPKIIEILSRLDLLIVHSGVENPLTKIAHVVFSSATYAEKNGTMTNFQGYVQRIRPAVATAVMERALDGLSRSRLDTFGAQNDRWMKGQKRDARPNWRICMNVANALGAKWRYTTAEDVFNEITSSLSSFTGMSYLKLGSHGMMLQKSRVSAVMGKS